MKKEILLSKKYLIRKNKVLILYYFLIKKGADYGIKIVYQNEISEVFIAGTKKSTILVLIDTLSENFTFPIELTCILDDLSYEFYSD